ncbi:hypothetical protein L198_01695 [Cryptococcus wingfieldii CBS 7118]|uniref:FHA domain-containing protein n=1 Tax=Cryptococcus wingfieldii CBS 7118 TaxID=1295528 RepID=A0A1E3K0B8_9TREE|nr:hypothetical protein L198_01695 [Cryptococcus wingfieldii CBS 7118]ODO06463.1 hypothetical protein L198_01695 [Cryptococcus wingfieldii CBS 7118]
MALPPTSHENTPNAWFLQLRSTNANTTTPREFSIAKLACTDTKDIPTKDGKPTKPAGLVHGGVILGRKSSQTKEHGESGVFISPILSRAHAQLTVSTNGHVYITDLSSLHGTSILSAGSSELVSLDPYSPVQLCQNDTIVLGKDVYADGKEFTPFKLQVVFAQPVFGKGSDKGTRKSIGKLTPEDCTGKFLALSQIPLFEKNVSKIDDAPVVIDSDDEDDIEMLEGDKSSKYGIPAWMRYASEAPISQARYENAANLSDEDGDDIVAIPNKEDIGLQRVAKSQSILYSDDEGDDDDYPRGTAHVSLEGDVVASEDEDDNEQDSPEVQGVREVIRSFTCRQSSPEYSPSIVPAAGPEKNLNAQSLSLSKESPLSLSSILNQAEGRGKRDGSLQGKSLFDDYQSSPAPFANCHALEGIDSGDVFDYEFQATAQRAAVEQDKYAEDTEVNQSAKVSASDLAAFLASEILPAKSVPAFSVEDSESESGDVVEPAQAPVAPQHEPKGQNAFDDAMSAGWPSEQDQAPVQSNADFAATGGDEVLSEGEEESGVTTGDEEQPLSAVLDDQDEGLVSDAPSDTSYESEDSAVDDKESSASESEGESESGSESESEGESEIDASKHEAVKKQRDLLRAITGKDIKKLNSKQSKLQWFGTSLPDIYRGPEECLDDQQLAEYMRGAAERGADAGSDPEVASQAESEDEDEDEGEGEGEDESVQQESEFEARNDDKDVQSETEEESDDEDAPCPTQYVEAIDVDAPDTLQPAADLAAISDPIATPSTSSPASDRILTPIIGQKRSLPQDDEEDEDLVPVLQLKRLASVQVPTETPGESSVIEVNTAIAQDNKVVQPPAKRRNVAQAMGLVVLGAALGSIGTIAGLMQLAEE